MGEKIGSFIINNKGKRVPNEKDAAMAERQNIERKARSKAQKKTTAQAKAGVKGPVADQGKPPVEGKSGV